MKTYKKYLKIIKSREYKEQEENDKKFPLLPGEDRISYSREAISYSVEIMGMMMQDFLEEIRQRKNKALR